MDRLDVLIQKVRRRTHTLSYTDSATETSQRGLQTQEIVELFNEAQRVAHGIIYANAPSVFIKTSTIDLVADQEAYTLASDSFLNVNVINVEYKYGSGSGDYSRLQKRNIHQRNSAYSGAPNIYIPLHNTILVNPVPSSALTAGLRVTYEFKLPALDVRRGKISSFGGSSTAPTSITLSSGSQNLADVIFAELEDAGVGGDLAGIYITVVDKDGNQQMANIPVTDYDSSTRVITLGSFTASSGEEIAADDWIVIGKDSSTHSSLPDFAEQFVTEYVRHAVLEARGNVSEARVAERRLAELGQQLADVMADANYDITYIPETDADRMLDI